MPRLLPENQSADYLSHRHMKVRDSAFLRSALGLLLLLPGLAGSEERLWLAGGEAYRDGYYGYLSALVPVPGSERWFQRYWLDTNAYRYDSEGTRTEARVRGAEAMLGYQRETGARSGAISLGVRFSDTRLSPDDPESEQRGRKFWPKAQAEGEVALTPSWRAIGIAAYTFGLDGYWTRARVLRALDDDRFLGPELVAQGEPSYHATRAGVVLGGLQLLPKTFLTVTAGWRWQSGANSPYGGIELFGEF
jgi:cellulose biosynthesis protein BcsS